MTTPLPTRYFVERAIRLSKVKWLTYEQLLTGPGCTIEKRRTKKARKRG